MFNFAPKATILHLAHSSLKNRLGVNLTDWVMVKLLYCRMLHHPANPKVLP